MVLSNFQKVFWSLSLTLNGLNLPAIALYHSFFLKKKPSQPEINTPLKNLKKTKKRAQQTFFYDLISTYIMKPRKQDNAVSFPSPLKSLCFFVGGEKKIKSPHDAKLQREMRAATC